MKLTFTLRSEEIRRAVIARIRAAQADWRVTIEEPKRSDSQNRRMWAALGDLSKQVEWHGERLSAEDWKNVCTASLRQSRVVPGLDHGTLVPLGLSTSGMSKRELSDLIELIYCFGSERGVTWSEPYLKDDAA